MVSMDSVIPTVATASGPNFETKNMSTTAKMDSITISSTMGTERRKIARPRLPSVKSCCEPAIASRTSRQILEIKLLGPDPTAS